MAPRYLVVMNPTAGRRRGRDPRRIVEALRRRGLDAELALTERRGHAREILRTRGPGADVVIVVGGDGTLHEVIQDLDLERHRLGLIPWGSGNDFAWSLGLSGNLEACLDRIAGGTERRLDLGRFEAESPRGRLAGRFHNQVGFGFEATVNQASHRVERLTGAAVYVWAFLRSLPRLRRYPVQVTWEPHGRHTGAVLLLAVGNGRRVGGCFRFFPEASLTDGKLDLLYTDQVGLFHTPRLLARLVRGSPGNPPGLHEVASPAVSVRSDRGIPVYVDGEFQDAAATSIVLSSLPGALRFT